MPTSSVSKTVFSSHVETFRSVIFFCLGGGRRKEEGRRSRKETPKRTQGGAARDGAHGSIAVAMLGRDGQFALVAGTHVE